MTVALSAAHPYPQSGLAMHKDGRHRNEVDREKVDPAIVKKY